PPSPRPSACSTADSVPATIRRRCGDDAATLRRQSPDDGMDTAGRSSTLANMSESQPLRVFTIPPGEPFLETLASAVLAGGFPAPEAARPDPLALSEYRLLVPTRRATRALAEAFLRAGGGEALLLPEIRPIGDVDEAETAFAAAGG